MQVAASSQTIVVRSSTRQASANEAHASAFLISHIGATLPQTQKRIAAFLYGSCIRKDVMALGVFLPKAVVVETSNNRMLPAICYMPPGRKSDLADVVHVEHIIKAARQHGFPKWYLSRLEEFLFHPKIEGTVVPMPNPSNEKTSSGKPEAASGHKRLAL